MSFFKDQLENLTDLVDENERLYEKITLLEKEVRRLKDFEINYQNEVLRLSGLLRVAKTENNDLKMQLGSLKIQINNFNDK